MALRVVEPIEQVEEVLDPVRARLDGLVEEFAGLVADALAGVVEPGDEHGPEGISEARRVDRVAALERLRGSVAAVQAAEIVQLARARVEREFAADRHPRDIGRGLAEEIGLACRLSPSTAARRLSSARALWFDLPATSTALAEGRVSEPVAEAVVTETRHLDATTRRGVDDRLADAGLDALGLKEAAALARRCAYDADREAYVARGRHERSHRRVGLRSAPDTMSVLSGYVPVEQGVACLAALRRHTDSVIATRTASANGTANDERTRDQIMADTLVERLTGQATATDVNVEVQIIIPLDALTDPEPGQPAEPAERTTGRGAGTATLTGAGPLPAALARALVDASGGTKRWRFLLASPAGHLVGISRRRRFTGLLADLIAARDQTCRTPYCDAPARHLDHIHRYADGGPTSAANGRDQCARHNLVNEQPGWHATLVHDGLIDQPHTVQTTTPTGHTYQSRAPDPP